MILFTKISLVAFVVDTRGRWTTNLQTTTFSYYPGEKLRPRQVRTSNGHGKKGEIQDSFRDQVNETC